MTLVWPNGTATEPARSDPYGPRDWIAPGVRAFHTGDDTVGFGALRSIGAGTVVERSYISWAGNQVLIYLGEIDGVRTWVRYCHLQDPAPVGVGTRLGRGDWVGTMGATGVAFGVHLHWEIYRGRVDRGGGTGPHDVGTTVDPRAFVRAHLLKPKPKPVPEPEPTLGEIMAFKSVGIGYRPDEKVDRLISVGLDFESGQKTEAIVDKSYGTSWYGGLTEGGFKVLTKGHYEQVLREFDAAVAEKRAHELAVARASAGK